jgi:serine protease Do
LIERSTGRPFDAEFLRSQSPKDILIRMLTNLMGVARDAGDPEGMLRYVDTIVSVDGENSEFRWFRAVLRFQTKRHAEAHQDTAWLLEKKPGDVELPRVRQLHRLLEEALQQPAE